MGNFLFKQKKYQSVVKLTCPYCKVYESYNIKNYDKHIISCINFKKDFTDENIIFSLEKPHKKKYKRRNAKHDITEIFY